MRFFTFGGAVLILLTLVAWKANGACRRSMRNVERGRRCKKPCTLNEDCRAANKKCLCDGACGLSCFNPNAECHPLEEILNGSRMVTKSTVGGMARYRCNEGFLLRGSRTSNCNADKRWHPAAPTCERIRCLQALADPTNGSLVGWQRKNTAIGGNGHKEYYEFEDVVTFRCDIGYGLIGQRKLECLSDGNWDSVQPYCKIKSCGRPEDLLNVSFSHILDFDSKRFEYSEEVTVECDPWYEMTAGGATWRCGDSKQWELISRIISLNPPLNLPKCRPKCGLGGVEEDAFSIQTYGAKKVKKQESWPWMAFVDLGGGRKGNAFCGGTLVDEKTVVTAAHCIYSLNDDDAIFVWVGILNRKNDTRASYTQKFSVVSREYEPSYGGGSLSGLNYDGDIAVLKLDRPVNFSYYIHPICIPNSGVQRDILTDYGMRRKKAEVVGWGETGNKATLSDDLLRIKIPLFDPDTCKQAFRRELPHYGNLFTENMICAGFAGGRKHSCKGDSGGPLMTKYGGRWYLTGIVSFSDSHHCGRSLTYGVYTDVSKYEGFLSSWREGN